MSRNGARDQRRGGRGTVSAGDADGGDCWPTLIALEDRRLMATFTVTNTADSGRRLAARMRSAWRIRPRGPTRSTSTARYSTPR